MDPELVQLAVGNDDMGHLGKDRLVSQPANPEDLPDLERRVLLGPQWTDGRQRA